MFDIIEGIPDNLEFIFICVYRPGEANRRAHIGVWYRPPTDAGALDTLYSFWGQLGIRMLSNW